MNEITEIILSAGAVLSALAVIGGIVAGVYKAFVMNRKQTEVIHCIQHEQRILCKAMRGALEGLIENGCNGPCKKALADLDEYLTEQAHKTDI